MKRRCSWRHRGKRTIIETWSFTELHTFFIDWMFVPGVVGGENIDADPLKLWFAASISEDVHVFKCSWRHRYGIRIKHTEKLEGLQSCISVWWQHVLVGLLLLFSGESFSRLSSIRQKCGVRFAAFVFLRHCGLNIFWVLKRTGVFSVTREVRKSRKRHFSRCTATKTLEDWEDDRPKKRDRQTFMSSHANMTSA